MVYILAGPAADRGPLAFPVVAKLAAQHHVPVLVDAAAEVLTIPNVHLERGATLVAYSGGKCIRGPQTAGLLLGRKDLVRAAWVQSAPHHGPGRSMKVGKEEAVAMLMAVEMWVKRDHKAEWQTWMGWLNNIRERVTAVNGVTASIDEPAELSNHTPSLNIYWDPQQFGYSGNEVADLLFRGEPRIAVAGARRGPNGRTGVGITAYMMMPGDDRVVADRIAAILGKPKSPTREEVAAPAGDLTGRWDVKIEYAAGTSVHHLYLKQNGNRVEGTHQGDFVIRDLTGNISGDAVTLRSAYSERHGDSLGYRFTGKLAGDTAGGTLDMGEYLSARWTATRHTGAVREG
jgi:L-seryl-tRNA(Ser) seleniumtransferase